MNTNELLSALLELEKTKRIDKESLYEALEQALVAAYKKNYGPNHICFAKIDRGTGNIRIYCQKTVVEEVTDPQTQISLEEAKSIDKKYKLNDVIDFEADPAKFGRIAAQSAKQIVVQRIREAERENLYSEFSEKENQILTGTVKKVDKRGVLVDVGNLEALITPGEQIPGETYTPGKRIKVYMLELKTTGKETYVLASRTHPGLVKKLFEQEVPEIADGTVEIKSISREAGSRSKMAVYSQNKNVDPVGACVGPKGARVAAVVEELGDEKIDIIKYSDNIEEYISASLSPAKVTRCEIDEETKTATVYVPDFQLSLAIGKEGQNARLAARLTGWKIDIKSDNS
ncbi:MAG: transcription termination/antitermination protein NusA [Clostridiaceae bacterium]|nr:transcription termination/antitermination protein NusA [Clostridiaceae bacterium]